MGGGQGLRRLQVYPDLIKDVRIRVIELMDHVLSTYDRAISEYTAKEFSRCAFHGQLSALRTAAEWKHASKRLLFPCGNFWCAQLIAFVTF